MKIRVARLGFQYIKGQWVFKDVNFSLEGGSILSILGSNGAGKSTMLNCLSGLYKPHEGNIFLDDISLCDMSRVEVARHIGYVPQVRETCFDFSVLEYTVMGRTPYLRAYERPSERDYAIAIEKLEMLGLKDMSSRIFTELSGGEQQLVMIARVLTQEAKLILLDEPTNHLDYGNQYRALKIMQELAAAGYAIICTTHNPDHALQLGGQAAILTDAKSVKIGQADEILTAETLSALYKIDIDTFYKPEVGRKLCYPKIY